MSMQNMHNKYSASGVYDNNMKKTVLSEIKLYITVIIL